MAQDRPEPEPESPDADDDPNATVARLLGRRPQGDYTIAVRRPDGAPVVLANAPFLHSGRPMPTRYWLIDPALNKAIGRLESTGGVKRAEAAVDPELLAATHDRYRRERQRLIPTDRDGPAPSGGVGGTRQGVKCLHAHYAYHLVGGDDPVGRWVHAQLGDSGDLVDGLIVTPPVPPDGTDSLQSPAAGERPSAAETATPAEPVVTIDIGPDTIRLVSEPSDGELSTIVLPIGSSTVTSAYLLSDPPDPAELSAALSVIELHLDDVVREEPALAAAITELPIVGTGAIRFVAEVELGVASGDDIDGYVLERNAAEELFRSLATESHEDRSANPGLKAEHVGWIVGAMCILLEFMRHFGVDRIQVSTHGLGDGVRPS